VPLGPIAEASVPVAETFASYLGDGTFGRLPAAIREARGLSYEVHADVVVPERVDDDASVVVDFTAEPGQVVDAIEVVLGVLREADISEAQFDRAKRSTEERYRSSWIGPRDLPWVVDGWRRRDLDEDPRPQRFVQLGQLTRADLDAFAAGVRGAPVIVSLAGAVTGIARDRLSRLGDVQVVTEDELQLR
jgi:predicted Zn-dependent peptidase